MLTSWPSAAVRCQNQKQNGQPAAIARLAWHCLVVVSLQGREWQEKVELRDGSIGNDSGRPAYVAFAKRCASTGDNRKAESK